MFNRAKHLYRRYFKTDELYNLRISNLRANIHTYPQLHEYMSVLRSNLESDMKIFGLRRIINELGELDKIHSRLMKLNNIDVKEIDEKLYKSLKDLECSVCLKNFEIKDTICITKCNHTYHKKCIDTWFEIKDTCPNCRGYIR